MDYVYKNKKQHNKLCKFYQDYKKECIKNQILARDFQDWFEYYNINKILKELAI